MLILAARASLLCLVAHPQCGNTAINMRFTEPLSACEASPIFCVYVPSLQIAMIQVVYMLLVKSLSSVHLRPVPPRFFYNSVSPPYLIWLTHNNRENEVVPITISTIFVLVCYWLLVFQNRKSTHHHHHQCIHACTICLTNTSLAEHPPSDTHQEHNNDYAVILKVDHIHITILVLPATSWLERLFLRPDAAVGRVIIGIVGGRGIHGHAFFIFVCL